MGSASQHLAGVIASHVFRPYMRAVIVGDGRHMFTIGRPSVCPAHLWRFVEDARTGLIEMVAPCRRLSPAIVGEAGAECRAVAFSISFFAQQCALGDCSATPPARVGEKARRARADSPAHFLLI